MVAALVRLAVDERARGAHHVLASRNRGSGREHEKVRAARRKVGGVNLVRRRGRNRASLGVNRVERKVRCGVVGGVEVVALTCLKSFLNDTWVQ